MAFESSPQVMLAMKGLRPFKKKLRERSVRPNHDLIPHKNLCLDLYLYNGAMLIK